MPVSLGRKIRRIGIPQQPRPEDYVHVVDENITNKTLIYNLRLAAKNARLVAFVEQKSPAKAHRRSKSRITRGREEVVKAKK